MVGDYMCIVEQWQDDYLGMKLKNLVYCSDFSLIFAFFNKII